LEQQLALGLQMIKSPTNSVWIIGRIIVRDESDMPNVLALHKHFTLTPLSQYGKPSVAPQNETLADFKEAVASPNAQDSIRFFEELRIALKINPAPAREAALINFCV
jgi:hypothetical protein